MEPIPPAVFAHRRRRVLEKFLDGPKLVVKRIRDPRHIAIVVNDHIDIDVISGIFVIGVHLHILFSLLLAIIGEKIVIFANPFFLPKNLSRLRAHRAR